MLEFHRAFDSNNGNLLAAVIGLPAIKADDGNIISVLSDRAVSNGGREWRLSKVSMFLITYGPLLTSLQKETPTPSAQLICLQALFPPGPLILPCLALICPIKPLAACAAVRSGAATRGAPVMPHMTPAVGGLLLGSLELWSSSSSSSSYSGYGSGSADRTLASLGAAETTTNAVAAREKRVVVFIVMRKEGE